MPDTKKSLKRDEATSEWTAEEKSAMRERAKEMKAQKSEADGEKDLLAKIAAMPAADRTIAERIHAVVKAVAPSLSSRTYYGMPAYAKDGKVLCFFQPADKFKARYATFGFNDDAKLDDGSMWATSWALTELTAAGEAKIGELVKKAVG